MKKVFRIHNAGASNSDWFDSLEPGGDLIATIQDDDTKTEELPSSIPSPFARMDLVRAAFKYVNSKGLEGKTYHHKLVSDALDIGQILFNYDIHRERLQLLSWNKNAQLSSLKNSGDNSHVKFAETLELFINQDEHFNFANVNDLYILKCDHKVIGGTSPLTLFFASPFNDRKSLHEKLKIDIRFGNDIMLDDEYLPLHGRDHKFVKYLYALSQRSNFARYFQEVYDYIRRSIEKIGHEDKRFYDELKRMDMSSYFHALNPLHVEGSESNLVYALNGFQLYTNKTDPTQLESDFFIDSETKVMVDGRGLTPLVLPVGPFNYPLRYTHETWDSAHPAPEHDPNPLEKRRLPNVHEKYPYLTLDDFLEKSLLKLPSNINTNHFHAFGGYLLPLKKRFFEFFSPETLRTKRLLEITTHTNSVEVKLNIPITGRDGVTSIQYNRNYKKPSAVASVGGYSGLGNNSGALKEIEFGVVVTPSIKMDRPLEYTVGILNMSAANEIQLSLFNYEGKSISIHHSNKRLSAAGLSSVYYVVKEPFDVMEFDAGNSARGILLPNFKKYTGGNTQFSFAVDFGTSNTHIEYKTDQIKTSRPFEITRSDFQILHSFESNKNSLSEDLFNQELFPLFLNDGSNEYGLPMRTAILQNKDVNANAGTYTFNHYNIAFDFEKKHIKTHLDHKTNIKWSNYRDIVNRKHLEHYIENILFLLRNKVLLNDGNLDRTQIIWFYPSSMGQSKVNALSSVWREKTEQVFGSTVAETLRSMTESVAPFYFYNNERGIAAHALPVASIDIGGGTADIVVYKEDTAKLITSFRYAGNAIFGDGYGGSLATNGFISKYSSIYKKNLKDNSTNLSQVLDQLLNKGHSEDIINFFFNLARNRELNSKNIKVDFARELAGDSQVKVVFLIYFASLFYHLAKLLLAQGYSKPAKLLLSGNGAKTAFIADQTDKLTGLSLLFNAIFDKLSPTSQAINTEIVIEQKPKEITAKGGLYSENIDVAQLDELMIVQVGASEEKYPAFRPHRSAEQNRKVLYQDVLTNDEILSDVVDEVVAFLTLFLQLHSQINFHRKFDVSQHSIKLVQNLVKEGHHDLLDDLKRGLIEKKKELESTENTALDESLFFYPLIGVLNRIAKQSIEAEG